MFIGPTTNFQIYRQMDLVIFSSVQVRDEKIDGAFGVRSMFLLARINEDHNYKTRGHKTMTIYLERESAFNVAFCWLVSVVGIHKNTHTHIKETET